MNYSDEKEGSEHLRGSHPGLFAGMTGDLTRLMLSELKREGIDPQEFVMKLLVKETSDTLKKLPKSLQQAFIEILIHHFFDGELPGPVNGGEDHA